MNERWEEICARLCLLTEAGEDWFAPGRPMTRLAVRNMIDEGVLRALVLRHAQQDEAQMERAEAMLSRVRRVFDLLEEYEAQGYIGMLPQDARWPAPLARLGRKMPLFLFVRGNLTLLRRDKIAIAGSRIIAYKTQMMAARIGRRLAREGITMVSGGAQGIDIAVQDAALEEGGSLILVPARTAPEVLKRNSARRALEDGRLLLLCDTLPDSPFTAAKALTRNNTIYALGDAALVLASRAGRGGSWHGATECLRGGWTPVFVTDDGGADMAGNRLLLARGAQRYEESVPLAEMIRVARAQHAQRAASLVRPTNEYGM